MAYPKITGRILDAAYFDGVTRYWEVESEPGGTVAIRSWTHPTESQPTEQQINDWATDAAPLPSGQLFSVWLSENGGDATLTAKRQAKEALTADTVQGRYNRALARVLLSEINALRAQHSLAARTEQQFFTAITNQIAADA